MKHFGFIILFLWACGSENETQVNAMTNNLDCFTLAASDCESKGCSPIKGKPYNDAQMCFDDWESVGCEPPNRGHQSALTRAEDTDGKCWFFSSLTIPQDWTAADDWQHPAGKHPSGCETVEVNCNP